LRQFNQANLDTHLADLARNLTPEQAQQVKERVREKISASNFDVSPEAIDGAFSLISALARNQLSLPSLGAAGDRLGTVLSALDMSKLSGGSALAGQAGEALGGVLGGLGKVIGGSGVGADKALGGLAKLIGGVAHTRSGAIGAVGDLVGNAANIADIAGALFKSVPNAGDAAGGLAGAILEALGDVISNP
jgi:hypothetical protein